MHHARARLIRQEHLELVQMLRPQMLEDVLVSDIFLAIGDRTRKLRLPPKSAYLLVMILELGRGDK